MMKKFLIICALAILPWGLFAQTQAVLQSFEGKVEVKLAGSETWTPVAVGARIDAGTTLSVGLRSAAVVAIGDTRISVKALTRLTLRELVERQGNLSTDIVMPVGRINADVKPVQGLTQTFKVQSPVATASVRGTSFDFDGVTLEVQRGEVAMINPAGVTVPVQAGERSVQNPESPSAPPQAPLAALIQSATVQTDLSAALAPPPPAPLPPAVVQPSLDSILEVVQAATSSQATGTLIIEIQ